jgi:hypothetical protein
MRTPIVLTLILLGCGLDPPGSGDLRLDDLEDDVAPAVFVLMHAGQPPTALDDLAHFRPDDAGQDPLCPGGPGPDDVDVPAPACAGAPFLGEARLLVDGVFADSAPPGARVGVLFPFSHSACELGCGTLSLAIKDHFEHSRGNIDLPAAIPCSTDDDQVHLAVDLGTVGAHDYEVTLQLQDVCGAPSQERHIAFTPD